MDHTSNASVALLMLDIASAKSSLAQLQQTFHRATAEHQRTLEELHGLREECDVSPVYARGATVADKAMCQQLQALHIENLQLKSLLKQEIEARQQLQHQHTALLGVLRSHGIQDIFVPSIAQTSAQVAPADAAASSQVLSGAGCLSALQPHEAPTVQLYEGAHRQGVYAVPLAADVAGTLHESIRKDNAPPKMNSKSTSTAAALGLHSSSAYFPAQHNHSSVDSRCPAYQQQSPSGCSPAWPPPEQQAGWKHQPAAAAAPTVAHHGQQCNLHGAKQSSNRSQDSSLNTGQQQQRAAAAAGRMSVLNIPKRGQQADVEAEGLSASESLSSSCSQSAATELLDSDDLEELAGLCDGLISQASRQHLVYAAMQDSSGTDAAVTAGGGAWQAVHAGGAVDPAGGQHNQQAAASSSWPHDATPGAEQQHHYPQPQQQQARKRQLDHHDSFSGAGSQHGGTIHVPDIEVLAAELNRLQQQVAAAGIDIGPTAAAVRAALGAASNAATSFRAFNATAASGTNGTTATVNSISTSSKSAGSRQPAATAPVTSGSGMADLQQQLAARMAEVKERLSNICNGMLEEALCAGGASARSPAATAAAAGQSAQGYADLHQHMDQHQYAGPPAAAETARPEPRSWSSSMSSSSSTWAAGTLKPQSSGVSSKAGTAVTKVPPSVAFEVHADGHADVYVAPAAPFGAGAGRAPSSGLKRSLSRVRVGGPAFWSGSRGAAGTAAEGRTQAGVDNRRSSSGGAQQPSKYAPGVANSSNSSDTFMEEALAGSSSESSWATADEAEAEQQEQRHLPPARQQQGHQQEKGCEEQRRLFAYASGENLQPDAFQSPPKQPQQHLHQQPLQQQYADLEITDRAEWPRQQWQQPSMYQTPPKQQQQEPFTGVSGSQQTSSRGLSPPGGTPGFNAATNGGMFFANVNGPRQQQCVGVSESLEGALFGLKGRVAAEVSQTFSPLKAGSGGAAYTARSPVTPLKPRNA